MRRRRRRRDGELRWKKRNDRGGSGGGVQGDTWGFTGRGRGEEEGAGREKHKQIKKLE